MSGLKVLQKAYRDFNDPNRRYVRNILAGAIRKAYGAENIPKEANAYKVPPQGNSKPYKNVPKEDGLDSAAKRKAFVDQVAQEMTEAEKEKFDAKVAKLKELSEKDLMQKMGTNKQAIALVKTLGGTVHSKAPKPAIAKVLFDTLQSAEGAEGDLL